MQMQNDIKAELLKQFPSEVIEVEDTAGSINCVCPSCKRPVASFQADKCTMCGQKLTWNNILRKRFGGGGTKAKIEFDIPPDFTKGDCRKCPLSYITRREGETSYDCPLNMRNSCKLEII